MATALPGSTHPPRKPRVCVMGFSLTGMLPGIVPSYSGQLEIRIINKIFEEALDAARELIRGGELDILIAAGANGAFLRNNLPVPVVLIRVSGFDILHALVKAREQSERIAIFSYQTVSAELEEVKELLKIDIEQCYYTTPQDAAARVAELAAAGFRVIVGSSMITRLAQEAGLTGVFLYSPNSVRQAFDDALEIARVARLEEGRREWLNSILQHLDEGVVAVDLEERVLSMNPAMARLLGVSDQWALGRKLSDIAPELSLAQTLRRGAAELGQIERVARRVLVINRLPLTEAGAASGAVLTCQDSSAIQRADRNLRQQAPKTQSAAKYRLEDILGEAPALLAARELAEHYARTDATVLITGESGTGKELFAQGIHQASGRRREPFVAINCGAFPEALLESELFGYEEGAFTGSRRGGKPGLFEAAHRGSIFLDEIGELPMALQARLLRVLQEREVLRLGSNEATRIDVRVIAATNRDLPKEIAAGRFRQDLYYRLDILQLQLPALRERPGDLALLARQFLAAALRRHRAELTPEALLPRLLDALQGQSWPGNVRQLENLIERVAVVAAQRPADAPGAALSFEHLLALPAARGSAPPRPAALRDRRRAAERAQIDETLAACQGNQAEAARRLGISRSTLWRKLAAASA
ncbi:Propionate catabolism operon regulatory protein [Burkholderiales bacterium]|nr:Propionate catabolism operon regulatory protein [Burkholderiales bacterium]